MNERKTKGLTNLNSDEKIIRDTCVSLARMYFSQFAAISCFNNRKAYFHIFSCFYVYYLPFIIIIIIPEVIIHSCNIYCSFVFVFLHAFKIHSFVHIQLLFFEIFCWYISVFPYRFAGAFQHLSVFWFDVKNGTGSGSKPSPLRLIEYWQPSLRQISTVSSGLQVC